MPRPLAPVGLVRELWWPLLLRLLVLWLWSWRLLLRRLLLMRLRVLKLQLPPVPHLLPWRQAEWAMANHGQSKWRLAKTRHFRGVGPRSAPSPNPGGMSQNPHFPSPSKTVMGRLASVLQLYEHAAEQPVTHHNEAGRGIMHLHPEMLPQKARCLGNQVTCMIAEYHLTSSARGPSSLSPIHLVDAAALLPPIKNYIPSIAFEGTRDVRVMDQARTLRVAVWLHRLDMAITGNGMASETLEVLQHHQGPRLGSLLTPRMSNLSFQEVVDCVLSENHRASQQSLHHLRGCRIHNREVLDRLIKAHREVDKSNKATQKSLNKEINQRHKSLKMLKECISYYETQLRQEPSEGNTPEDDGQFGHSAQAEMAPTPGADDTPSESTTTPAFNPPPAEGQTQDMEVDDDGNRPQPPSPVSHEDDDLLTGSEVIGVESGLAHLMVSSPRGPEREGEEASD